MPKISCLAGISRSLLPMFRAALIAAGVKAVVRIAQLNVAELGKIHPDLLLCDVDKVEIDQLELLRRIRFVLPSCMIAVYTGKLDRNWGVECHIAGANCLLTKNTPEDELAQGLRAAIASGCYTAPGFAAA